MKRTDTLTADEQRAYALRMAQVEIERILATFPELRQNGRPAAATPQPPPASPRRPLPPMSPAARKRMSARLKARWREAKAKGRTRLG